MNFEQIEKITLFGSRLIDFQGFGSLLVKFAIDLIFAFIVVRLIFYPAYRDRDYVFSNFLINVCIFLICFLMASIKLKIGFAFGLFAVFSIIRYRTEQIPIREMTYMFIVIILGVLNALSNDSISYLELLAANIIIVTAVYVVENNMFSKKEYIKIITYEKIDLIKPENYDKLIADLNERTGFKVNRAEIQSVNFLNDTAKLKVMYEYPDGGKNGGK